MLCDRVPHADSVDVDVVGWFRNGSLRLRHSRKAENCSVSPIAGNGMQAHLFCKFSPAALISIVVSIS